MLSVLLHAILVVLWRTGPAAPGGPAEAARAAPVAALGGGALQALSIAAPRPLEIPAPPEAAELADEPVIDIPEVGGAFSVTLGMPGPTAGEASGSGPSSARAWEAPVWGPRVPCLAPWSPNGIRPAMCGGCV